MPRTTLTLGKTLEQALRTEAESDGARSLSSLVCAALMRRYGMKTLSDPPVLPLPRQNGRKKTPPTDGGGSDTDPKHHPPAPAAVD